MRTVRLQDLQIIKDTIVLLSFDDDTKYFLSPFLWRLHHTIIARLWIYIRFLFTESQKLNALQSLKLILKNNPMKKITLQNIDDVFKAPLVSEDTNGYTMLESLLCDSSWWGLPSEPAYTPSQLKEYMQEKIETCLQPLYVWIIGQWQFQVRLWIFVESKRNPNIKKIAVATTKEITPQGFKIKYHDTVVYEERDNKIFLDNWGWQTNTTKKRINQFLPKGYYVNQRNYQWYLTKYEYIDWQTVEDMIPFERGNTLDNITII